MKLKLSLVMPNDGLRDITLSCDVTATVAEAARAPIIAGASGNRQLEQKWLSGSCAGRAAKHLSRN